MGKYFGTDGFRGRVNVDLSSMHAYRVGRFLGTYFTKMKKNTGQTRARIVIGKDTRLSSYMLEYSVAAGIAASGADACLLHVTTTPSVAYVTKTENFDCGIMISASHNPFTDNGIKLINRFGEKMEESVISQIEEYLDLASEEKETYAVDEEIGRITDLVRGRNRYMGYLISLGKYSFKGIKIALDCANGSGYFIAPSVFSAMGAKIFVINDCPNGTNINKECGSTHIEGLARYVKENNLDVGFAYDGDGDRCLCVDENGNVLTGDHILYLCALHLKKQGQLEENKIVSTVMSNMGLDISLAAHGISVEKTDVGDKFVYEQMEAGGAVLGGEQSGHIIFSKYATTGDGILTSLMIMEAMISSDKKLGELCSDFKFLPQYTVNLKVRDKRAAVSDREITDLVQKCCRELLGLGRVILRASGTEPVIRVMTEADTEEKCRSYCQRVADAIKAKGYLDK